MVVLHLQCLDGTKQSSECPIRYQALPLPSMSPKRALDPERGFLPSEPETAGIRMLLANILQRAVRDFMQYRSLPVDRQRFLYALDAWEWFLEDDTGVTSFVSICHVLNLDVAETRCMIAQMMRDEDLDGSFFDDRESTDSEDLEGEAPG